MFAWTPLVDGSAFTGIQADVTTIGTGIIATALIVLGVFLIIKAMSH